MFLNLSISTEDDYFYPELYIKNEYKHNNVTVTSNQCIKISIKMLSNTVMTVI